MSNFVVTKLLNKDIPSEMSKFFTGELTNYIVIKDGHIITEKLEENLGKLNIKNINKTDISIEKQINSGLLIEVPKNFYDKSTLHIFYIQENGDLNNYSEILLNDNSELKYFEYLFNMTKCNVQFASRTIIKENAKLTYSSISNFSKEANVLVTRSSNVSRYGNITYSNAEVNDANTESLTKIYLEGDYASGTAKTVAITSGEQKVKIKQIIEHLAPDTEGFIQNYGVSNNKSFLVFEGVGKINKNMKRSIARQQNRGIVLGMDSRLDANPLLLIDEYDVEASHGAAIGKIDEEQLYYLMSRGLTLKNAERLIISGFLSPIIKLLSTDELIEDFKRVVERKTL